MHLNALSTPKERRCCPRGHDEAGGLVHLGQRDLLDWTWAIGIWRSAWQVTTRPQALLLYVNVLAKLHMLAGRKLTAIRAFSCFSLNSRECAPESETGESKRGLV